MNEFTPRKGLLFLIAMYLYIYDYDKLRKSIDKSMEEVIEAIIPDVEVPTPKRRQEDSTNKRPLFACSSQPCSSRSPNVMVSFIIIIIIIIIIVVII